MDDFLLFPFILQKDRQFPSISFIFQETKAIIKNPFSLYDLRLLEQDFVLK